jgi:hypothetical protein
MMNKNILIHHSSFWLLHWLEEWSRFASDAERLRRDPLWHLKRSGSLLDFTTALCSAQSGSSG